LAEGGVVRPVDAKEAAKGRVDYAKIKDWGTGGGKDIGELRVESFSSDIASKKKLPLYEALAKRLEVLQVKDSGN
jgi:hypothetical protein